MKSIVLTLTLAVFCLTNAVFAQNGSRGEKADISLLNVNSGDLLDRGGTFVGSSFIKGAPTISDFSGGLSIGHSMDLNYPNDLKTKLSLVFNANTPHAYMEDFVGRANPIYDAWPYAWNEPDLNYTGVGVRENLVNAACWIFGVGRIAVQATNFEKNFYLGNANPNTAMLFSGSEVPLLATGYQYCNDLVFPWESSERCQLIDCSFSWVIPNVTVQDKIRLMGADGTVITLVNPVKKYYETLGRSDTTDPADFHRVGLYFDQDQNSSGYAIVSWMGETYGERKIWYKPGDGLTYYFEEEYARYQDMLGKTVWGARRTNPPKIAYLRYIESQNGDRISFTYDYSDIFGVTVTNGRKFLKTVQYYKNSTTPVAGSQVSFSYVRNQNTYKIIVSNALAGQAYTIELDDNPHFTQAAGFNTLERNASPTRSAIMQVRSITSNANSAKKVTFSYADHFRRYTYGGLIYTGPGEGGNDEISNIYHLTFPTKLLTSREVYHGEKTTFAYCVSTELDGTTPIYGLHYNANFNDGQPLARLPREYQLSWGYYTNTYLNCPNQFYGRYYYNNYPDTTYWWRYFGGYNFNNMNHTVRDNYTATMMDSVVNSIYNNSTGAFSPVSSCKYAYSWDRTLYCGGGVFQNDLPFSEATNKSYWDLSPRITNIITAIRTTNLTPERASARNSYTTTKRFEIVRTTSKFINRLCRWQNPAITSEIRLMKETVSDDSTPDLQSVTYNYNNNGVLAMRATTWNPIQVPFYQVTSPTDMGLTGTTVTFRGVTKATTAVDETYSPFLYVSRQFVGAEHPCFSVDTDSCFVFTKSQVSSITAEAYRAPSAAVSNRTLQSYTDVFGFRDSTALDTTKAVYHSNFNYRPALPTEAVVSWRKGTGSWQRQSRDCTSYYTTADVRNARVFQQISYGATDDAPVTTSQFYKTSGEFIGYLDSTYQDNGASSRYLFNGEVSNTATGKLYCTNGTTSINITQTHGILQSQPFKTVQSYNGRTQTVYQAFNGDGTSKFAVDANGYYSASIYDSLGRPAKQFNPGNFDANYPPSFFEPWYYSTHKGGLRMQYNDALWIPEVTQTSYMTRSEGDTSALKSRTKFSPADLAYERYGIEGATAILKSKEKLNYLGKRVSSEDGDGVKQFHYYDELLNPSEVRFVDTTSSAAKKTKAVEYGSDPTYFKRVLTTDENGHYQYEYFDLFGNTLKTDRYLGGSPNLLSTTFAYDDLNRLASTTSPAGRTTTYEYDARGNVSSKVTPDAGTATYLYDKSHNVRFIRDANHRGDSSNAVNLSNQGYTASTFTQSGVFTLHVPGQVSILVDFRDAFYPECHTMVRIKDSTGTVILATVTTQYQTTQATYRLPKGSYRYEVEAVEHWDGVWVGPGYGWRYSITCSSNYAFIYRKYDALNRMTETGEYDAPSVSSGFTQANADDPSFPSSSSIVNCLYVYDTPTDSTNPEAAGQRNLLGRLSYAKVYKRGSLAVSMFYSYNELGKVEWIVYKGLGYYAKKLKYDYDMLGNVTRRGYRDVQTAVDTYTFYEYGPNGLLRKVWTDADSNGTTKTKEAEYVYTPSGRPSQLLLGPAPLQTVDYTYNSRGWLSQINDLNNLGTDKFAEKLGYDQSGEIAGGTGFTFQPQKNGNISWMAYRMAGVSSNFGQSTETVGWVYSYDNADRLLAGDFGYKYSSSWYNHTAYDEKNFVYDADGNIQSMRRYGAGSAGALMDDLGYHYYYTGSNRLAYVSDNVPAASFAADIDSQSAGNYGYDGNGNMIRSTKDGIGFTIYDINNLPIVAYKSGGQIIDMAYDPQGNRVRKYMSGSTDTYYLQGPDGVTDVVQRGTANNTYTYNITGNGPIGQLRVASGTRSRYYFLKDHLGSTRMVLNSSGTVDSYSDFYPFGQLMDGRNLVGSSDGRYKFTGKERDAETGYDYFGARYYDARIGRWLAVDPLAGLDEEISPFVYVRNQPLLLFDPTGEYYDSTTHTYVMPEVVTFAYPAEYSESYARDLESGQNEMRAMRAAIESSPLGLPPSTLSLPFIRSAVHEGLRYSYFASRVHNRAKFDFKNQPRYALKGVGYVRNIRMKPDDFGNATFGAFAHELGVPLWIALLGAGVSQTFLQGDPDFRNPVFYYDHLDDTPYIIFGYENLNEAPPHVPFP